MGATQMSSKERVLTAIARQAPDRVPVDYMGNPGITGRLKAHFGLRRDDTAGLLRALGTDLRYASAPYIGPPLHGDIPDRHIDPQWGYRTRRIAHDSGDYWDFCDFPLRECDEEQAETWPMPSPDDYDYERLAEQCRALSDYCVCYGGAGLGCIINRSGKLRGMDLALMDLATDDPAGMILVDRKQAVELEVTRRALEAAGDAVDALFMGEDVGSQDRPMVSLELYRQQIRPRHQPFVDLAKAHGLPVMFHCCGASSWAFDDFIEMGIDVVQTLQPEAKDMSPAYLKGRFGDRLAFHGCVSTGGPLAYGSPEDVSRNVRETLETMMPGGGYILSPSHQMQDNTPTENALAMYETARAAGGY